MALKPFRFPLNSNFLLSLGQQDMSWSSLQQATAYNRTGDFKMYLTLMEGDLVSNKEDSKIPNYCKSTAAGKLQFQSYETSVYSKMMIWFMMTLIERPNRLPSHIPYIYNFIFIPAYYTWLKQYFSLYSQDSLIKQWSELTPFLNKVSPIAPYVNGPISLLMWLTAYWFLQESSKGFRVQFSLESSGSNIYAQLQLSEGEINKI